MSGPTGSQLATGVLINTTTIEVPGQGPRVVKAGSLVTDVPTANAILAMGGVFGNPSDPIIVAAQLIVQKFQGKQRAGDEKTWDSIMWAAWASSIFGAAPQHLSIPISLAQIQAETTAVAFNVGPNTAVPPGPVVSVGTATACPLPTNAKLLRAELTVTTPITGGTLTAMTAKVQGGADTAGSIIGGAGGSNVFAAGGPFISDLTGSSPYASRSSQQLTMLLTATGDTLAHATAGALILDLYYTVQP